MLSIIVTTIIKYNDWVVADVIVLVRVIVTVVLKCSPNLWCYCILL